MGQKPWKREKLLVRWSIVNFAAQVEKKNPAVSGKAAPAGENKRPPGEDAVRRVDELGGKKNDTENKLVRAGELLQFTRAGKC